MIQVSANGAFYHYHVKRRRAEREALPETNTIKIGDLIISNITDEAERISMTRDAFANQYCRQKGWDKVSLSCDQILEIRQQDG